MYHGESTKSPDDAGKLMMALNIEQAEKDLRGAVDHLASQSSGDKLGIVGFCMGGQLALFAASQEPAYRRVRRFLRHSPERQAGLRRTERTSTRFVC